ncbi:MAG: hypothetical protein ACMUIP_07955 [bacterium]
MARITRYKKKGEILRIKKGYNPNSSSVGSQIPYLFSFFVGTGMITIIILHIFSRFKKIINAEKNTMNRETMNEE